MGYNLYIITFVSSTRTQRPVGQAVKTPPFHGGNTGSNPVRVIWRISSAGRASALQAEGQRFDPVNSHFLFYGRRGPVV